MLDTATTTITINIAGYKPIEAVLIEEKTVVKIIEEKTVVKIPGYESFECKLVEEDSKNMVVSCDMPAGRNCSLGIYGVVIKTPEEVANEVLSSRKERIMDSLIHRFMRLEDDMCKQFSDGWLEIDIEGYIRVFVKAATESPVTYVKIAVLSTDSLEWYEYNKICADRYNITIDGGSRERRAIGDEDFCFKRNYLIDAPLTKYLERRIEEEGFPFDAHGPYQLQCGALVERIPKEASAVKVAAMLGQVHTDNVGSLAKSEITIRKDGRVGHYTKKWLFGKGNDDIVCICLTRSGDLESHAFVDTDGKVIVESLNDSRSSFSERFKNSPLYLVLDFLRTR